MSAFYDLASLVLVPSGYKASKVYAQKPLTTDGQLSFSRASTATRVNSAGLIETVSSNVPRLDYLGSTCPKILLEPQRTNISGFVESGTGNYNNATVTSGTSILGLTTFRVTSNYSTGDAPHINNASDFQSGTAYTASAYFNLAQTNAASVQLSMFGFGSPNGSATVNLNVSTKAVTTTATSGAWSAQSGKATLISGSIYRLEITATAAQTFSGSRIYCNAADDTKYCEVAGIQIEAGAYATSFTGKSTTAAVTRLADVTSKSSITSLIGQTNGTAQMTFVMDSDTSADSTTMLGIHASTSTANRIQLLSRFGLVRLLVVANSSIITNVTLYDAAPNEVVNVAFKYGSAGVTAYVNGTQVYTTASAVVFTETMELFTIGNRSGIDEYGKGQRVSQTLLFTSALTNPQLAELTAL